MMKITTKNIIQAAIAHSYKGRYDIVEKDGISLTAGDTELQVIFVNPDKFSREKYEEKVAELLAMAQDSIEAEQGEGSIQETIKAIEDSGVFTRTEKKYYLFGMAAIAAYKAERQQSPVWLKRYASLLHAAVGDKDFAKAVAAVKGKVGENAFKLD